MATKPNHCNQCGRTDGKELPKPIGTCCDAFLPQNAAGQVRCGNCGWQSGRDTRWPVNGVTFAQLQSHRKSQFGRFG